MPPSNTYTTICTWFANVTIGSTSFGFWDVVLCVVDVALSGGCEMGVYLVPVEMKQDLSLGFSDEEVPWGVSDVEEVGVFVLVLLCVVFPFLLLLSDCMVVVSLAVCGIDF